MAIAGSSSALLENTAPAPEADVLTADDPLYEDLYDVRREAESLGNFIDRDVTGEIHALRA
jgi:hypothetical protein